LSFEDWLVYAGLFKRVMLKSEKQAWDPAMFLFLKVL